MIARWAARLSARAEHRVHDAADAAARARGLRVERAGRLHLTRVYRDPRWSGRHAPTN